MSDTRLPVVLFWHMHQPPYRDALSGRYVLPWTYLHAIKDYSDMAAHLERVDGACAVVNFSPVLIEQIEDIGRSINECLVGGKVLPDSLLVSLADVPLPQSGAARLALLRSCLRADRTHLIERHAPYCELVALAESFNADERIGYASDVFLHDIAVWYHIAWMGEAVQREHPLIARLVARARGFTVADRRELLALIGELVSGVLPRFRALADAGRCELAVSPYSHPILPLLCDLHAGLESEPDAPTPHHSAYPGGAERAAWHLQQAVDCYQRVFGRRPRGCWPSEGAVSDEAVRAIEAAGFDWLATSVSVLRASLEKSGVVIPDNERDAEKLLNQAFALPGSKLACYFRHDRAADLIGFTYSRWHGDDAAANFIVELEGLESATAGEIDRALLVALDGENAWEYYPYNGWFFLQRLYEQLANHPRLRLVTLSQLVDERHAAVGAPQTLASIRTGSWVYGTLSTWIGSADKNAAWDLLCEAKLAYDQVVSGTRLDAAEQERATRQLAACEASDWFWWFGDYNPAGAVRDFDQLFRHQLTSLYRALKLAPPVALENPLSAGHGVPESGGVMRRS
jgi:alpha-amylase/alpha-mannosidase (GH57 family)